MPRRVVLGVDGGGTKTVCVALDCDTKRECGRAVSGCSNRNSTGGMSRLLQTRCCAAEGSSGGEVIVMLVAIFVMVVAVLALELMLV